MTALSLFLSFPFLYSPLLSFPLHSSPSPLSLLLSLPLLASLVAQLVKNLSAMQETWVLSLGWEDTLENGKATHPSIRWAHNTVITAPDNYLLNTRIALSLSFPLSLWSPFFFFWTHFFGDWYLWPDFSSTSCWVRLNFASWILEFCLLLGKPELLGKSELITKHNPDYENWNIKKLYLEFWKAHD